MTLIIETGLSSHLTPKSQGPGLDVFDLLFHQLFFCIEHSTWISVACMSQ